MDDRKTRPLEINTQSRHMVYRKRYDYYWFNSLSGVVQLCFEWLWSRCDVAGCVDPDNITDFNVMRIKDESKFLKQIDVFEELNKYRNQIRQLDNGMWLMEDYYMVQNRYVTLDFTNINTDKEKGMSGPIKGLYYACKRNGVCPTTLRGVTNVKLPAEDRPHTEEEFIEGLKESS